MLMKDMEDRRRDARRGAVAIPCEQFCHGVINNPAAVWHGAQIGVERLDQFHGMQRNLVKLELCHIVGSKMLL